jgi:hypothetical protein
VVSQILAERSGSGTQAGVRTFSFQPAPGETQPVAGTGSAKITGTGRVGIRGSLNNASAFTYSTTISSDGYAPVYVSRRGGTELLFGWLQFMPDSSVTEGTLYWFRTNSPPIAIEVEP